jgi:microcystin-dependent protein
MSEPYIGEIRRFAFNFAPVGWAMCNGQLLPIITENLALFSLIGTYYGGDGKTNFALPNLQGRAPVHTGQGPGLSPYTLGQSGGEESVTLTSDQLPVHGHGVNAIHGPTSDTSASPAGQQWAYSAKDTPYTTGAAGTPMAETSTAGGDDAVSILSPFLVINYCIALEGAFPSRP